MIVIGKTTKGYWPARGRRQDPRRGDADRRLPEPSVRDEDELGLLRRAGETFEEHYGVEFEGIRDGAVTDTRERLIQFKTNIDVAMSVLDRNGLGDWLADRLVEIGDTVKDDMPLRIDVKRDPFLDDRLRVANLPVEPQKVTVKNPRLGRGEASVKIALFRKAGEVAGARRGISEIIKWMNYVTDNRLLTLAADLSESINLEHGSLWGHYDPETNPLGTRIKAAIQEAGNVSTAIGLVSQSASVDPDEVRRRVGVQRHLRRVHAADVHCRRASGASRTRTASSAWACCTFWPATPVRRPPPTGAPTSASSRPQVWKLFPRGQTIQPELLGLQRRRAGYFAAAEIAAREKKVGHHHASKWRVPISLSPIAASSPTPISRPPRRASTSSAISRPANRGTATSSRRARVRRNLVSMLPKLEEAGINVKVIAAISEELFDRQPEAYRNSVLPPEACYDLMVVSTGTRRMWPLRNVGPLTDEYSLTSDWDNQWLTGGLEADVIAEAHLDPDSILAGIQRFAGDTINGSLANALYWALEGVPQLGESYSLSAAD